jgi:hypothetical protein
MSTATVLLIDDRRRRHAPAEHRAQRVTYSTPGRPDEISRRIA